MSYEDLVAKRAEREAKEQAKAKGKGKRGRKRKSPPEADAPEADAPEADVPKADAPEPGKRKCGRKRKSPPEAGAPEPKAKVVRMSEAPEPARAPVAATIEPPTVEWLLQHRDQNKAQTIGDSPLASLYRMFEFIVTANTIGLRNEIESFFNHPSWAVSAIPDPNDAGPTRYAILSVIPHFLMMAFNRLVERDTGYSGRKQRNAT